MITSFIIRDSAQVIEDVAFWQTIFDYNQFNMHGGYTTYSPKNDKRILKMHFQGKI